MKKLTLKEFIDKANIVHNFKYDYINSIYINSRSKIIINCKICKVKFAQNSNKHLSGKGCPACGGTKKITTKEFIDKANIVHNFKYDYSKSIYANNHTKIIIICKKCHNEFTQTPNSHLAGYGCKNCFFYSLTYNIAEFIDKANIVHNFKYDYSKSIYANNHTKIIIICKKCHNEFTQTPHNHLAAKGCAQCCESKGEKIIRKYLLENNINFENQFKISKCKNKRMLSFDFSIFEAEKLIGLIEFQGMQHYKSIKSWDGEKGFIQRKFRDSIKSNFCRENNIPLLIIPYWNKNNIEEILNNFIININRCKYDETI